MDTTSSCRVCVGEWPHRDALIWEGSISATYLYEDQFFRGWVVVVLRRHATELFELIQAERSQLIEEVTMVARALAQAFSPRKVNYELLGNVTPHIHWHLVPRLADDPAPDRAIWTVAHQPVLPTADERVARIGLIRRHLGISPI